MRLAMNRAFVAAEVTRRILRGITIFSASSRHSSFPLGVEECNPKGCWKLAGDNIPGRLAIMKSAPGGGGISPKHRNVVSHVADGEKTSYRVFPRPARAHNFIGALTGDVIPGSFPAVLRTDVTLRERRSGT
jgi:hypothetical protein